GRSQERRRVRTGDVESAAFPPELLTVGRFESRFHDGRDLGIRDEAHLHSGEDEAHVILVIFGHRPRLPRDLTERRASQARAVALQPCRGFFFKQKTAYEMAT